MTTATTTPRELLIGQMRALIGDAAHPLTAEEGAQYDALEKAVKILGQVDKATLKGVKLEEIDVTPDGKLLHKRRSSQGIGDNVPPDGWQSGSNAWQPGPAASTPRVRGRKCAELFGVHAPSDSGFKSIEEVAQAIQLGDSRRTLMLTGAGGGIPSDGGFLVPQTFMFDTLDKSLESEIVRPRCRVEPMTTPTKSISTYDDSTHASGVLYGGLTAQWIEEGGEIDYQFAKVRQIQLVAKTMVFLTAASNELLQDAPSYSSGLTGRLTAALNWNIDRVTLATGTGAGQPKAIMHDAALITVAKETNQPADTIVWENLTKMFSRLHPACLANSVWVVLQSAIPQLLSLSIAVGTGGSVVPVMSESNGQFKILTRPVVITEKLNPLGDLGDCMLVDLSQYAVGIVRNGMRLDQSSHLLFKTDESTWRLIVHVDGQGTWKQAFQPVNSADTLSWCVTLAARA